MVVTRFKRVDGRQDLWEARIVPDETVDVTLVLDGNGASRPECTHGPYGPASNSCMVSPRGCRGRPCGVPFRMRARSQRGGKERYETVNAFAGSM